MCPFHDYDNYKSEVKLTPGIEKKGKAAKPALNRQRGSGSACNRRNSVGKSQEVREDMLSLGKQRN